MQKYIQLSGKINIIAAISLLAFWMLYAILLPYQKLDTTLAILVIDQDWVPVNLLGATGSVLGLVGLTGIYLMGLERTRTVGLIGFLLAFIGAALLTVPLVWDTFLWPILAEYDPSLLQFDGPIYTSKTFIPFFITSGSVYSLGYLLLGISMAKSGVRPYWGSLMLAAGAPLFGMGSMFGKMQVYPRTVGIILFCAGLTWIGFVMRTAKTISEHRIHHQGTR